MSVEKWFEKEINEMLREIAQTKDLQKIKEIFDKILTPREINDMGRRHAIIKLLNEGKSYGEIQEKLQISSAIIAKVSNKIGYGFRRTNKLINKKEKPNTPKPKKVIRRYKGAVPIHRLIN